MASRTEEGGVFEANFPDNKLTLYLAQDGARVLRVTFHETSSWCHEITWICTLFPDKYSPYFNSEFPKQLSALREQFATHGRLTSIQIDRWMFVFGYNTGDTVNDMLRGYISLKKIILKFLHDIDAHVTDITMKSQVKTVDAAAVRRDKGPETVPGGTTDHDVPCKDKHDVDEDASHSHPQKKEGSVTYTGMTGNSKAEDSLVAGQVNTGNTNINISLYLRESSGKADYQTNWETTNDIPQRPFIYFESLATRLKQMFNAILLRVRMGSMVFCFEHESKEDATNMIIRHAEVKEVFLDFLQELDTSIQDIRMKVEFRELYQPEEQTADTSETRPRGMTDPEHKGEEGTSRSHPQEKDETSHLHIQETGDDSSSLSHSPQKKKKYEDTCLPHPQVTEEDKTSLQQTDEDTSHLQPQEVYVKEKFKYKPIKIEKGSGPHCSGYTSSDPSLKPLVKGQDSGRRASSDPSQGHSQSEEDPRLSTASHASSDPSRRRWYPLLSTASHATPSQADRDLYYASGDGDLEEVKRLLSTSGVNVNCRGGVESRTPVMEAAFRGHRDVVELLVSEGADVSLVGVYGNNTLHYACMKGDVEAVKFVLSLNVADINSRGEWSRTPVMQAALRGHRDVVELLVSKEADVSLVDGVGDNILHYACWGGDVKTVKFVLSLNVVEVNSRGRRSTTPVMQAALRGHRDVVELLASKGADVSLVDEDGDNILHYVCMEGDVETVKFVLSLNVVDINSRGRRSTTPVMWAARWGHRDVVELLVSKGADVSLVDENGDNILHHSCMRGDVEMVKYVLSLNVVDNDASDNSGLTAADLARLEGHQRVVDLLVSRGAQ